MQSPETILQQYWGYPAFRPLQREIVDSILSGQDTLALLPTGGGKSVCYQVPAIAMDGVCIVVSPLIALMQDQVSRLQELKIPAASLHSGLSYRQVKHTLEQAAEGSYKLLYLSPERLQTQLFRDLIYNIEVSFIAVDEAHCISQWGHDFRPSYCKIATLRDVHERAPILALTATATPFVKEDIAKQLQLRQPAVFTQSFARHNIFYDIRYSENKNADTVASLNAAECSIIYCRSRKLTETLAAHLAKHDIKAAAYHAGMPRPKRAEAQNQWMTNKAPVMVATTAFGMGIDKPDVRKVINYDAPEHLEAYYQEAGRAGRDGMPSAAVLLYNSADIHRLRDSIELQYPPEAYLRQVYQAVAEYLQVPTGTQPDRYFDFELTDFCKKFRLQATPALYALKLLEQEGLWTLTEAVYHPATVLFTTDRHTLDSLSHTHPDLAYLTVGLLRMYNTIFHYPTYIREYAIARQLKMRTAEVEQLLQVLHRMEILEYNRPGDGPQLFFHHYRVDSQHLLINMRRINELKTRHIARTEAMITFLGNKTTCRQQMLLTYFGECAPPCGHCDVCRDHTTQPATHIAGILLRELRSRPGSIPLRQLLSQWQGPDREAAIVILRRLADDGIVLLDATNNTATAAGN